MLTVLIVYCARDRWRRPVCYHYHGTTGYERAEAAIATMKRLDPSDRWLIV